MKKYVSKRNITFIISIVFIALYSSACKANLKTNTTNTEDNAYYKTAEYDKTDNTEEIKQQDTTQPKIANDWLYLSNGLFAHAGGGIGGFVGTNSYEAIVENYNNGHRVFELDFNLTTDRKLVCVHDWPSYKGPLSLEDFLKIKIADRYTAIELKDVFELMMEHKDMYIVTDTKSFEYTETETIQQFQQFYDTAKEYDLALLDRVIPQIYNQNMYKMIKEVYPFKSIIYTLYASPDSDEEVVSFVKDKDDIVVITMGPVRYSPNFYNELKNYNKYIYFFTLNSIEEIQEAKQKGVHGFYTDFITPDKITK